MFLRLVTKTFKKTIEKAEKKPEVIIDESQSDPPVQGPSNIVKVTTEKGKLLVVKREGDAEVEVEVEPKRPDL